MREQSRESRVPLALATYRADNCVSIYLPVDTGEEGQPRNLRRLRNALTRAHDLLQQRPCAVGEATSILATAWTLHDAATLWAEPDRGLALFVAADRLLAYRLPRTPMHHVVVDDHFHLEEYQHVHERAGR